MRLRSEHIRACPAAGWKVLVTGSKFFGDKPFAGALLIPAPIIARASQLPPLLAGLADHFSRAEWPEALQHLTGRLPDRANLGLVLRRQAALWEMRAFETVQDRARRGDPRGTRRIAPFPPACDRCFGRLAPDPPSRCCRVRPTAASGRWRAVLGAAPRRAQGRADRPLLRISICRRCSRRGKAPAPRADAAAGAQTRRGRPLRRHAPRDSADPRPRAGHPGSPEGCQRSARSSRPPPRCCRPRNAA
jgi:hypothetical protein